MKEVGQPITHRPSMMAWVDSLESFASISSETEPPEAGPSAMARIAVARMAGGKEAPIVRVAGLMSGEVRKSCLRGPAARAKAIVLSRGRFVVPRSRFCTPCKGLSRSVNSIGVSSRFKNDGPVL
eukprot:3179329-Rhodomonas_salina.1